MPRPALEVADIFRDHGAAWRAANAGHVSLGQLKVMSAIEDCRTAALGGHVVRCDNAACGYTAIAYNSCRNRHCPKCQGAAAREWLWDACDQRVAARAVFDEHALDALAGNVRQLVPVDEGPLGVLRLRRIREGAAERQRGDKQRTEDAFHGAS